MESDRISTVKIIFGDKITEGVADGGYVAQFPAGANCIELEGYRGELTNVARVGIRADNYPCFLCKIWIQGPEKESFEWSYDGATWNSADHYIWFKFVTTVNQIFFLRSQTYEEEEFRDYIENYLYAEFKAPIGSSGSGS